MKTDTNKIYKTPDLSESAYLLIAGFPLITTEKDSNGRVYFIFQDSSELQREVMAFISDIAKVSPRRFYYCWRDLRSKI